MCGLFGYVGTQFNRALAEQVAGEALRRGAHAHGYAHLSGGRIQVVKRAERPERIPLDLPDATSWLIGHARLATAGSWQVAGDNQPLLFDRLIVAHNGTVADWPHDYQGYQPTTGNDSEAINALWRSLPLPPMERAQAILQRLGRQAPTAFLLATPDAMLWGAIDHPLYVIRDEGRGLYLCSRPIPGHAAERVVGVGGVSFARSA